MLYDKVQAFLRGCARRSLLLALVAAVALAAAPALAGPDSDGRTPVNAYGSQGRKLAQTDAGALVVAPEGGSFPMSQPVCESAVQSVVVVGTSAVAVPASPLGGRKVLRVCVSLENAGSPKVKCALDSHPIMGFVVTDGGSPIGDVMGPGDCYSYAVDTSHTVKCVSDTAGTGVLTYEC